MIPRRIKIFLITYDTIHLLVSCKMSTCYIVVNTKVFNTVRTKNQKTKLTKKQYHLPMSNSLQNVHTKKKGELYVS